MATIIAQSFWNCTKNLTANILYNPWTMYAVYNFWKDWSLLALWRCWDDISTRFFLSSIYYTYFIQYYCALPADRGCNNGRLADFQSLYLYLGIPFLVFRLPVNDNWHVKGLPVYPGHIDDCSFVFPSYPQNAELGTFI